MSQIEILKAVLVGPQD